MTLLDAFGSIFSGIWAFITAPAVFMVCGVVITIFGAIAFLTGLLVPHYGPSELRERLATALAGPVIAIVGIAIIMWAGSAANPTSWGA